MQLLHCTHTGTHLEGQDAVFFRSFGFLELKQGQHYFTDLDLCNLLIISQTVVTVCFCAMEITGKHNQVELLLRWGKNADTLQPHWAERALGWHNCHCVQGLVPFQGCKGWISF